MRIDITNLNTPDSGRNVVDSAVRVKYSPTSMKQLLVTTASNKLLKFDARTGKILAEVIILADCYCFLCKHEQFSM